MSSLSYTILVALGATSGVLFIQLQPFPDRLASLSPSKVSIDNVGPYDAVGKWAPNGSVGAGLHRLNPARVAYFHAALESSRSTALQVLDIGCGGGLVSNALASFPGYEVHGIDRSSAALQYAQDIAEKQGTGARFQRGSVYVLPFSNESFDAVVMSDVLEHLLDVRWAVREAARVLRPGGTLLFDTIDRSIASLLVGILGAEYIVGIVPRGSHDWRLFIKPEELKLALRQAGFHDFTFQAFQPSPTALWELSLLRLGLVDVEALIGEWHVEPPSSWMVSYIGSAIKQ